MALPTLTWKNQRVIPTALLCGILLMQAQTPAQVSAANHAGQAPYRLILAVDEVSLTFHAADSLGLPINDLKLDELGLTDNSKPPRRVVDFRLMQDFPIRAGILFDSSESMERALSRDRAISIWYAQNVLRQNTDQAFVMDFGYISRIAQGWTNNSMQLTTAIQKISAAKENPLGGTAIFDTIFRACFNEFGKIDHASSGNFILLFSDGEDNASHVTLEEAVGQCQRSNTAIYAFRAETGSALFSPGPKTLAQLASQTGGRVFADQGTEETIDADLRAIETDLRNQYRLVYNPAEIKPDGSFHRIQLSGPHRVDSFIVRSGYYAPRQ